MSTRHRGRRDQQARAAWVPKVATGTVKCWSCGLLITPDQEWDLGHLEDIATGGAAAGPRLPEHTRKVDCPAGGNRSRGAELGRAIRRGETPNRRRTRLAEWLEFLGWPPPAGPHLAPVFLPTPKPFQNRSAEVTP